MNNKIKLLLGLFVLSTLCILIGALAKIRHWDNIKPLMLAGLLLQTFVIAYALILFFFKKEKQ